MQSDPSYSRQLRLLQGPICEQVNVPIRIDPTLIRFEGLVEEPARSRGQTIIMSGAEKSVSRGAAVREIYRSKGCNNLRRQNMRPRRMFLIGMLFGVMLAAVFTYKFAIPANSDYWRTEIYNRGGGAWTMDMKSGHTGWKWLVEPIPDAPAQKPVTVPASHTKSRTEKL